MQTRSQAFSTRQNMNGGQFEVFHYRARRPENIGIHHHDFFEIYFFQSGNVDFRVEGRTYRLEPGDLLLISPQEFHQAQVDPEVPYERFVLWIDRNFLAGLGSGDFSPAACFDSSAQGHSNLLRPDKIHRALLQNLLEKMDNEFYSGQPGSSLYVQGLLMQFLVEVGRLAPAGDQGEIAPEAPDLVSQVLSYIGDHFQENITLEQIAAEFFVSKYYLSHEFRDRVGTSIYRYVICKRLLQARELMEAGQAPGAVYQSCGFGDYANFYRAFRGEYGISPREFFARAGKSGP